MTKEELLQELSVKIMTGEIHRDEALSRINVVSGVVSDDTLEGRGPKAVSINKMLYFLGAAIVLIGIMIFIGQLWDDLGSFGRILVTLGVGLALTFSGSMLLRTKPEDKIGPVFHALGGLLIPSGAMVLLYEMYVDWNIWSVAVTFGIIFAFYLFLNSMQKHPVLTIFSIGNGTAFVYFLMEAILEEPFWSHGDIFAYLTMAVGVSYILLGKSFIGGWNHQLTRIMYFLGSSGILIAAFSQVFGSELWQLLYFLLAFGGLALSVRLKSSAILTTSTLALLAHVSYITGEYFADSLSWPLALIILGFVFIGLGYLSISINKRYITA
ncbi:MAG: hypothetical protein WD991_01570 [Candidatus Paceibacterota bacterium]